MKLTINNKYHNSSVNVRVGKCGVIKLSRNQVKRVEQELCGIRNCTCGSMWSHNHTEIEGYENAHFEPIVNNRTGETAGAELVEN